VNRTILILAVLLGATHAPPATAGGFTYRGPFGEIPPNMIVPDEAPGPTTPPTRPAAATGSEGTAPSRRRHHVMSFDSWRFWWGYNRASVLRLRSGLTPRAADAALPKIRAALRKLLDDTSAPAPVRAEAALALGKLGASRPAASAKIARRLVTVANDARGRGESSLEEHAIVALGLLGRREAPVVDMLLGRLTNRETPGPRTRGLAAIALGFLRLRPGDAGCDRVRTAYKKTVLTADDDDLRIAVLVGMGLSGDKVHVPELLAMVALGRAYRTRKVDDRVRSWAASAAGRIAEADPSVFEREMGQILTKTMLVADRQTSRSAILAAGRIGGREGVADELRRDLVRTLESLARRAPAQARGFALISLGKIGAATDDADLRIRILHVLLTEMREGTFRSRPYAALGLGLAKSFRRLDETRNTLRPAVRAELFVAKRHAENRAALAIAAGLLVDYKSVRGLIQILADRGADRTLRGASAIALGLIRDRQALRTIRAVIAEPENGDLLVDVPIGAAICDDSGTPRTMLEILRNRKRGVFALGTAATVVADYGWKTDPLFAIAEDPELPYLNRAAAVYALGLMADLRGFPLLADLARDINYRATVDVVDALLAMH
jgi:HEAT repeat protein